MNKHEQKLVDEMRRRKIPPHMVRSYDQARAISEVDEKYDTWQPGERYYVHSSVNGVEFIKIYE